MANLDSASSVSQSEPQADELFESFIAETQSSSDEEAPMWGGSQKGKAPNKKQDFTGAHTRLVGDCFNGRDSVCNEVDFERRFRMPRSAFARTHDALMGKEPFVQKEGPTGPLGMRPLVKLVACGRCLECTFIKLLLNFPCARAA